MTRNIFIQQVCPCKMFESNARAESESKCVEYRLSVRVGNWGRTVFGLTRRRQTSA